MSSQILPYKFVYVRFFFLHILDGQIYDTRWDSFSTSIVLTKWIQWLYDASDDLCCLWSFSWDSALIENSNLCIISIQNVLFSYEKYIKYDIIYTTGCWYREGILFSNLVEFPNIFCCSVKRECRLLSAKNKLMLSTCSSVNYLKQYCLFGFGLFIKSLHSHEYGIVLLNDWKCNLVRGSVQN